MLAPILSPVSLALIAGGLGPNLLLAPDFSDAAPWTDASVGTGTAVISGSTLTVSSTGAGNAGKRTQSVNTTPGKRYQVDTEVLPGGTGGEGALEIAGAFVTNLPNGASTPWQFTAVASTTLIGLRIAANNGSRVFSRITVRVIA